MNDEVVIKVENLSKVFRLYDSPFDRIKEGLNPFRKKYHKDFYALQNVDFEVKRGESIALIGHNGSGKSTLLKLLTGVQTPTSGSVRVNGRVSALLELGAGFNPELTGVENIYFNGTLMGFSREEIDWKLDEILSFADIGDFARQPIKVYSSGMFVRLAFALAINIEPEILIIDEALAVGDVRFQLKCFRKMEEFKEQGKTFLIVTHDMSMVINLCSRALWLRNGMLSQIGDSKGIAYNYLAFMNHGLLPTESTKDQSPAVLTSDEHANKSQNCINWDDIPTNASKSGEGGAEICRIALYVKNPYEKMHLLKGGEDVDLYLDITAHALISSPLISFIVYDMFGKEIFGTNSYVLNKILNPLVENEEIIVRFNFIFPLLHNGKYMLSASIVDGTQHNHIRQIVIFDAYEIQILSTDITQNQNVLFKLKDANLEVVS